MTDEFKELAERVVILQALAKIVNAQVSTKNPDSYRSKFDDEILELYEQTGAKSFEVPCGTVSVRKTKEKQETALSVHDKETFEQWLLNNNLGHREVVYDTDQVIEYCVRTGEIPEGADLETYFIPEQVLGTTLKVDEYKVADALQAKLPTEISKLLTE